MRTEATCRCDAWLVGPIESAHNNESHSDQVLVIDEPSGLIVITGCSHPDAVSLVKGVKSVFGARKVKLVVGGFHFQGISKNEIKEISLGLQTLGINQLAVGSCAGESALKILRKEWDDRIVVLTPGESFRF